MIQKIFIGVGLVISFLFSSCIGNNTFSGKRTKSLVQTLDLNSATLQSLSCSASSADFIVEGDSTKAYIEMYAQGSGSSDHVKAALKEQYEIQLEQNGGIAKVFATSKSGINWNSRIELFFKIHVPANITTEIKTSSGEIKIKNINGNQRCIASSGDIDVENVNGDLSAETTSGDVAIKNIVGKNIEIHASSGNIQLHEITSDNISLNASSGDIIMDKVSGDAKLSTNSGDQNIALLAGSLLASSTSGSQQIAIENPKGEINLTATSGDIHLEIPQTTKAQLNLKGNSVSMSKKPESFLGEYSADKQAVGSINGGGMPITVRTTSGEIGLSWK